MDYAQAIAIFLWGMSCGGFAVQCAMRPKPDLIGEGVRTQMRKVLNHERFTGPGVMTSFGEIKTIEGEFNVVVSRKVAAPQSPPDEGE